ncbi:MAG: hypothetical protein DWI00_02495 [Planctomycetota bacterium]|nr:MAG: hypothetical protein DWI00_02495 [Planctomycetota bacterium]
MAKIWLLQISNVTVKHLLFYAGTGGFVLKFNMISGMVDQPKLLIRAGLAMCCPVGSSGAGKE